MYARSLIDKYKTDSSLNLNPDCNMAICLNPTHPWFLSDISLRGEGVVVHWLQYVYIFSIEIMFLYFLQRRGGGGRGRTPGGRGQYGEIPERKTDPTSIKTEREIAR